MARERTKIPSSKPARTPAESADPPRKRRSAEDARHAILDAAERMLLLAGPSGIRLQEVAAQAGLSHPTVLHHFGNREGLVEAVVERALDSLHQGLLAAVGGAQKGPTEVAELLERVFDTLSGAGSARAVLWLALEGYQPTVDQLHIRDLALRIHEIRCAMHTARHGEAEKSAKKRTKARLPTFEDTYFTVLLPALALLSMSVMEESVTGGPKKQDEEGGSRRFRAWLARRVHEHLQAPW